MLIENNTFAHIVIEHVVICILEKSIQENTEKRVPIFVYITRHSSVFLSDRKRRSTHKESRIEK